MHDRTDRVSQDRSFDDRKNALRKQLSMAYQDPLHIDPAEIPENMDYMWIRDSVRGEPDKTRMSMQKRRGWAPVPVANHPDMVPEFDSGRLSHLDGYIHYNGLILCQRPKEYGDIEREMESEANFVAMQNIPGDGGRSGLPTPTKTFANKTQIQTMQSFKEDGEN